MAHRGSPHAYSRAPRSPRDCNTAPKFFASLSNQGHTASVTSNAVRLYNRQRTVCVRDTVPWSDGVSKAAKQCQDLGVQGGAGLTGPKQRNCEHAPYAASHSAQWLVVLTDRLLRCVAHK